MVSPTWVGRPSSIAQRAIVRMDAMISETDEGHEWSQTTGKATAANLLAVARALEGGAMKAPPSD